MEEDLCQRDQRGLFQRCKSLKIEEPRKVSSQFIREAEGIMLRDPGLILGRWARFFGTLLNSKFEKLRLDIIEELPQWPITHELGVEPAESELIGALRSMANAKAVGPDELPVELLKLGINHDPTVLREFHRGDQGGVAPTRSTAAMARCGDKGFNSRLCELRIDYLIEDG